MYESSLVVEWETVFVQNKVVRDRKFFSVGR
jgi:hypothetical protein